MIATEENGTVYKLRKTGEDIVSVMVDDREIPKEEYPQYASFIDAMEQARKQKTMDGMMKQEEHARA